MLPPQLFRPTFLGVFSGPTRPGWTQARPVPVHATSPSSILCPVCGAFPSPGHLPGPTCCVCCSGQGRLHAAGPVLPGPGARHLHAASEPEDHQADMLLQPSGQGMGQRV